MYANINLVEISFPTSFRITLFKHFICGNIRTLSAIFVCLLREIRKQTIEMSNIGSRYIF